MLLIITAKCVKHIGLVFCCSLLVVMSFAQAPLAEPFVYANVARNGQNMPVVHRNIEVQLSILKGSGTGQVIYQENHLTPTGYFGEFEVAIGNGEVQSGGLDKIDWSQGHYFLKAAVDTDGGTNFETVKVQRLDVPYGLYAKSCGLSSEDGGHRKGFKHYIGELYGGGVIFNLWKDSTGSSHGLIVALTDQGDSMAWSDMDTMLIGPAAQSMVNGSGNTVAILAHTDHANSAALVCRNYAGGGYHDWYLPSAGEMDILYYNSANVEKALKIAGNPIGNNIYWSSTEITGNNAWAYARYGGTSNKRAFGKYSSLYIRAIRGF